jgi:hypothetical protein
MDKVLNILYNIDNKIKKRGIIMNITITQYPYKNFTKKFFLSPVGFWQAQDKVTGDVAPASIESEEFRNFKRRPEYAIGLSVQEIKTNFNVYSNEDVFDILFTGVALLRAAANLEDPDEAMIKIQEKLEQLHKSDFYTCPASTIYHEAEEGGLLLHTLNVYENIIELKKLKKFGFVSYDSAVVVALMHDLCKCGLYQKYLRNVKNDDGKWEQVEAFKIVDDPRAALGHGIESAYRASKYFNLSRDEFSAIRWHMGLWYCSPNEYNDLQHSNEQIPLVHLLQFADQLAITKY